MCVIQNFLSMSDSTIMFRNASEDCERITSPGSYMYLYMDRGRRRKWAKELPGGTVIFKVPYSSADCHISISPDRLL